MTKDPLAWIGDALAEWDSLGLRRRLAVRAGPQRAGSIFLDGRELINFGSNDYLGLAADGRLADAVSRALPPAGWGSGASPLVTGRGTLHAELENELAKFEGTEAALLFSTGFAANVGAITALAGKGDVIFSDAKNHASIIDGCRLSGARVQIYPHRDVDGLANLLRQAGGFRRRLIVTDSLFSMDGDLAPLAQLAELAEQHDAILMADEAHATGVFGDRGRGVTESLGVEDGVHVRIGTLSKALGSIGGFVAGPQKLIDWLANRARTYVFSTAPPEAMAAAGLAALRIVRDEPHRRMELLDRAAQLREQLTEQGCQIGDSQSQIIPVLIGDPTRTMHVSAALRDRRLFIPGIRPPTVPEGQSLLRISMTFAHSGAMLDQLLTALAAAKRL